MQSRFARLRTHLLRLGLAAAFGFIVVAVSLFATDPTRTKLGTHIYGMTT